MTIEAEWHSDIGFERASEKYPSKCNFFCVVGVVLEAENIIGLRVS
jgi:hypothetical protein